MKIGIFGGAFDPLHIEHIKIIEQAKSELHLDRLILLLSYSPPHKGWEISPFEQRAEFLQNEFLENHDIIIDKREYGKEISYSYELLAELRRDYPFDDLIYIIGGDSMEKFHTWAKPEIIAKIMPIAVVLREGYGAALQAAEHAREKYGAEIVLLPFEGRGVSSSMIKAGCELGIATNFLSENTKKIIHQRGMYQRFAPYVEKIKSAVSPGLFTHLTGTVMYAMKFCTRLNLNYDEVFLSALLHDSAKEKENAPIDGVPDKVLHQFRGAELAESEYGIKNPSILDAIRYHTTGKENMSELGRLIYVSDMLEENRTFPEVGRLRELLEQDFEEGFLACLESSMRKLERAEKGIYFLTQNCYNYYINKRSII